ncbi:capsule biosynthesis protein capa [hydrocarbon metagenome]|uniref:Capsule biosynthesis protein capa n=1 Tax=hydrocarbon metagenome TaxID=938273 RepID=A0A0W8E849_9ZZZZ
MWYAYKFNFIIRAIVLCIISTVFCCCSMGCHIPKAEAPAENQEIEAIVTEAKPLSSEITLVAVGDCLMHNTQIWSGQQADGTYNFDCFFAEVQNLIKQGDYSSISFEAPLAGPESGYTGYPLFNSPDAVAQTFKRSGFDLVTTANNHAFDRGYPGAMRTLEVLRSSGLDTIGTYVSEEESKDFLIKDIRGVKVGYLAYSYGTNGIPIPAEKSYCFNLLDRDQILSDISKLRPQVDVLILILHWGSEYMPQPNPEQEDLAYEFLDAGADVILGSHPHVIQPMKMIEINQQDKLILYSMGNIISHQQGLERNSGIILEMKFSKNFDSKVTRLVEVRYTPTYSHSYYDENGHRKFRVVPVEKTLEDIKDGLEPFLTEKDIPLLQQVLESTTSQLGENFRADV